jgi:hypothetical protein
MMKAYRAGVCFEKNAIFHRRATEAANVRARRINPMIQRVVLHVHTSDQLIVSFEWCPHGIAAAGIGMKPPSRVQ